MLNHYKKSPDLCQAISHFVCLINKLQYVILTLCHSERSEESKTETAFRRIL